MFHADYGMIQPATTLMYTIKMTTIAAIQVMFSPFSFLTIFLLLLGLCYMICVMQTNSIKFKDFFIKNKVVILLAFISLLAVNTCINKEDVVSKAFAMTKPREKMCTIVTEKMLDFNYLDSDIKDAMDKSGCNPEALPTIKMFWNMRPKPQKIPQSKFKQYDINKRQGLET